MGPDRSKAVKNQLFGTLQENINAIAAKQSPDPAVDLPDTGASQ